MSAATSNLKLPFRNEHLSVSRLKLYEQCALAFYYRYIDKGPSAPRDAAAAFGTMIHEALERLYRWVRDEEFRGLIPPEVPLECYRLAWQSSELTGLDLYNEGLKLLRAYVAENRHVDAWDIIDVEREFNVRMGRFVMNGYIDRVDRLDDKSIVIIDYKSNRMLFTKDELENDLQMSIYGLAARELYPWAEEVHFVFHMLRHGRPQKAVRTARELDDAREYVQALGEQTEVVDREWKAKLNANCSYCDGRNRCEKYQDAITKRVENVHLKDLESVEALVVERERVAKLAKYCYARAKDLDELLIAKATREGEFEAAGYRVHASQNIDRVFSLPTVVRLFGEVGIPAGEVEARVTSVGIGATEEFVADLLASERLTGDQSILLKTKLDALAAQKPQKPKINVVPVKGPKRASTVAANDTKRDKG